MNRRSYDQKLQVEPEDVPPRENVRIYFDHVLFKRFEELLFGLETLHVRSGGLFEAQALSVQKFVALTKLLGRHANLEDDVVWVLRVRKRSRARITLNIERHDSKRRKVVTGQRSDETPVRRP